MGANILKGGAIFLGHSPLWGGGGDIPRIFVTLGRISLGGDKSPAWAKIYLAPQILRPGAATASMSGVPNC